jgi:hypothetical protein
MATPSSSAGKVGTEVGLANEVREPKPWRRHPVPSTECGRSPCANDPVPRRKGPRVSVNRAAIAVQNATAQFARRRESRLDRASGWLPVRLGLVLVVHGSG